MNRTQWTTRHVVIGVVGAGALLVAGIMLFGPKASARVDVVEGIKPVSTQMLGIAGTIDDMAKLPVAERGAYLERNWPHLSEDMVFFLQRRGKIAPGVEPTKVEFYFGSMDKVLAENGDGGRQRGYFANQLVAVVTVPGQKDPIKVLVQCTNGTFALVEDLRKLQAVGEHTPQMRFTLGAGEGFTRHLDYPAAIQLAQDLGKPLFRTGRMTPENRITPDQARALESSLDWVQVTVGNVFQGDKVDLIAGTYTPVNGQVIRFHH